MRLLILFLLFSGLLLGQHKLIDSLKFNYSNLEISNIGLRLAYNSDSIVLLDSSYNSLFTYDYASIGSISSVNSTVGLKIQLFDKINQSVTFLDKTLSLQSNSFLPAHLGLVDEIIWLDNGNFALKNQENHLLICDPSYNVLYDSGNLDLIFGLKYEDAMLFKGDREILITGTDVQIRLDENGAYLSSYRFQLNNPLLFTNDLLFHSSGEELFIQDLNDLFKVFEYNLQNIVDLALFDGKMYLLSGNMLYIYNIQ